MVDLLNPMTLTFIKDVGFPITLVLILLSALAYMVKKDEKRQTCSDNRYYELSKDSDERYEKLMSNSDERYDKLLNKFISEIKDISDKHDDALKEISNDLKETVIKFNDYMGQRENLASKVIDQIDNVKGDINDLKDDVSIIKDCIQKLHPESEPIKDKRRVPKEYR